MDNLVKIALDAAIAGGVETLKHYLVELPVEKKADGSPVTIADKAAHQRITEMLSVTGIPIVSEESPDLILAANEYWLVDPLDGTKDFLDKNDEFTVNVGLIRNSFPVLGVVHAPAKKKTYLGAGVDGAWLIESGQKVRLHGKKRAPEIRLATSRFHDHPGVDVFSSALGIFQKIPIGSALKYCLLASAEVDVFPRLAGCSEWDTAAGQAILEATGGAVLDWASGTRLKYGKAGRRNPPLISFRAPYSMQEFQSSELEALL